MDIIEHSENPFKVELDWHEQGVRIVVSAEPMELPDLTTDEIRAECNRRAKVIVDHFKQIIPQA